jgi:HK97 gp10 family phage protein
MAQAAFKFKIHGLKETMDALEQLPTVAMKKAAVRKALEKAAEPIKDAAIQNAKSMGTGGAAAPAMWMIAKTIKIGTLKKSQQHRHPRTTVARYVGASHPLAHLFEFGTARRVTTGKLTKKQRAAGKTPGKAGLYRGYIPAKPFLRQAWDAKKTAALGLLKDALWTEIAKAARRLAKKAERGTLTAKQKAGLM